MKVSVKPSYFKSRLFLKYISSYLFVLLIPLVCLTFVLYHNTASNLRAQIEQSHLNQLTQAETIVDTHLQQLNDIASRAAYDPSLSRYRVHDAYYSLEAIDALGNYKAASPIVDEMFLYFRGDPRIYSSVGMYDLDVFADKYRFKNWTADAVERDLNEVRYTTMRPADRVERASGYAQSTLVYLVPMVPNSPNPHGTLMYFVKESSLTGLIDSILGGYEGSSYIFDAEGRVLAVKSNQDEALGDQSLQSLVSLSTGTHSVKIGGVPHSVVSVKSELNGWEYVTLMPSAQFFSSVLHIRAFIVALFSIVVVFGGIGALLLARRQYSPIFQLSEFAESKPVSRGPAADPAPDTPMGELERIRSALQAYSARADLQEPYARNHFLLMLLRHGDDSVPSLGLPESFGLQFDRSRYFAMLIGREHTGGTAEEARDWQLMLTLLSEAEYPELGARLYGVELPKPDQIALIVGFDLIEDADETSQIGRIASAVYDHLQGIGRLNPSIGIGTCADGPERLSQSFIEACSAFESRTRTAEGSLAYFSDLTAESGEASWVPKTVLLKLAQSLKQGSADVAARSVAEAAQTLRAPGLSAKYMRCIGFDILNTILKTADEVGVDNLSGSIPAIEAFSSPDELEQGFLKLVDKLCEQVEEKEECETHTLMDTIVAYIDEHYADHSLSLETISHNYSISMSYFSRSFKDKVGTNFVQYIWQKRMAAAIVELTTTDEPLKEIIQRIGYQDAPNFIRKFKKETGHTPGQYRKLFSDADGSLKEKA
ncbi:helix-turn-helix domain-containing protein [Saccharibacillus brassicae]|uniref:AraC family transcriptional regulator n=1 Tax=Saccharibacillus brassicae TaxID=2583377 RepID=A0A4Y6UZ05_SACBS|nr:helix-turn-helix domain-containing protein [Saccharibacillus brassicae]QDH22992.1 AraC family transcriptional regulator [Saccharibacillus brassicae]